MNKHVRLIYLLLITFALSTRFASAQTTFGSEEELKTQAAKLFDEDEFEEAYPLYSQLTSIYPKDPTYNYRLGVCMLYASDDKEKPVAFLEFAANKPDVEKEVFFYLARAYHLNYRFDDAIKQYLLYKNVASAAKAEKLMVDRQIEMCKSGKKLLRNLTDLVVIEKKEMSRADFFRSYDISDIGGKLLVKPDEDVFKSALDKKKKEKSIIYLATNNNQVFFSSYGDDPERGKDIYIIRKLPTGEWSKPQTLGYPVNSEYDEDFPFLHPNGKVLYFCSKGHNSMGGYDIYKATLNEETNTWNKPVNLDFPINTPDDDILYITNESESEAYFSSARASKSGKTAVYHINVERKPIDISIIKGAVVKNRDNQPLDVRITVKDLNENVILGMYNSKAANGVYLINIPNGGKFLFTVEATGFATQSDVVEMPVQYVFRPMKQEISYELGTDKLIIKNLFDEVLDDASYLLALNFIKEKSKMEVSDISASVNSSAATVKDVASETAVAATTNKDKTIPTSIKLSNNDIVKIGYADAEDVAKEAKDLHEQADVALVLANQKNELSVNKSKEAAQLMDDASKMDDNVKKQATIEEANAATKEAEELSQETVAAFNLAKKIEFRAEAKEQESDLSMQYAKDLEAAVKSKNSDPALFAKLEEQQKKLDALSEQNNNPTLANSLKMDVDNKKRELDKAVQTSADIKQEITDNEALIITTQADADKERNEKVKQGLIDQVTGLKMDTEESKKDLALNEQKVVQLQKEYNGVVNETALVSNVFDKAKTGTSETAAADLAMIDKAKLEAQVNTIKNSTTEKTVAAKTSDVASNNTAKLTDSNKTTNNVALNNSKKIDNTDSNPVDNNSNNTVAVTTNSKTTDNTSDNNTVKNSDVVAENASSDNATETKIDYAKKYADDIVAAENQDNVLERENKKAELYKEWSASISEDLVAKKSEVKTEKDKTKKKELNTKISSLEKELKEKQKTTATLLATIEKLKKDETLAAANTTKTDNSSSDNAVNENTSGTVSNPAEINKKYSDEIEAANGIAKESDREKAKAAALTSWSKAIDADVAKKKQDMDASSDPEMKALLAIKIKQSEALSKEKQKEAEQLLAKAEGKIDPAISVNTAASENSLKLGTNTLADNTTKTTETDVVKTTDNLISGNASKTTDNVDVNVTENTKDAANVKSSDNAITDNVAKTTDNISSKKTTESADGKTNDNAVNSTSEKITDIATTNTADKTNPDNTSQTSDNSTSKTQENSTPSASKTSDIESNSAENGFAYTSPFAVQQATKAGELSKEAEELTSQSNDLKTKAAAENNTTTKNAIYAEAEEFAKQAERKELESAQLFADANKMEYATNQYKVDQFVKATQGNTADDISIAELMKDEADSYFNLAAKSREIAANATSFYQKESALDEAYKNELIALEKQKNAKAIYLKYTPDVASQLTSVAVVKNTDNTSSKSTDASIAKSEDTSTTSNTSKNADNDAAVGSSTKSNDAVAKSVNNPSANNNSNKTDNVNTDTTVKTNNANDTQTSANTAKTNTNKVADNNSTSENIASNTTIGSSVNDVFVAKSTPVYSSSKPIPVNEKLPEGLIFKVQIGAFRNPIPQDLFKGMSPITGETTPQGFIRYTAGLFTTFATADKVKEEIQALGYKDAFVVGFYNGKRVAMTEAIAMAGSGVASANKTISVPDNASGASVTDVVTSATTIGNNRSIPAITKPAAAVKTQSGIPAIAESVTTVTGLFYTVQVGVYSQPVSSAKLYNVQPLYTEVAPNGNLRYNTGIYNNIGRASEAKNMIVDAGIKDAFIVAYINGKRISMTDAAQLIFQGSAVFSTAPNMNALPTFSASVSGTIPNNGITTADVVKSVIVKTNSTNESDPEITTPTVAVTTIPEKTIQPLANEIKTTTPIVSEQLKAEAEASSVFQIDSGVVFKVQIGAFKDEVPLVIANKFLKVANRGVKNYKDSNGLTIYTVGTYRSYEEASAAKSEISAAANITDAFIVAYKDGLKIPVDEAKTIIGK
jgi:hypothetical protein